MEGKYGNRLIHTLGFVRRERLRSSIAKLVDWEPLRSPEPGCTAIVGVCSRLPDVLAANIRCLMSWRWPELKQIIAVFDCEVNDTTLALKEQLQKSYPELDIKSLHYSTNQSRVAEELKLPYVYCWLSWCIAIKHVKTSSMLIHDYDALVLGPALQERYDAFVASKAKFQGIAWYLSNGVKEDDRLATTFESFADTAWLRSQRPIDLFNKVRAVNGRSIDFDITLESQHRLLKPEERTVLPMHQDQLVHPSQMIHQYTMFRHSPGKALPSSTVIMIPFFAYLSGSHEVLHHANRELISKVSGNGIDLLGDGTRVNLSLLNIGQVDWALKQMTQASLGLAIQPDKTIYEYGVALYKTIGAAPEDVWRGDFTSQQREWIDAAKIV